MPQELRHAASTAKAEQDADDRVDEGPDVMEGDDAAPVEEAEAEPNTETKVQPDPDEEQSRETLDSMMNDLRDAPTLIAFTSFYKHGIAILAEKAPGLHAQLQEAIAQYKAAKAAGNRGSVRRRRSGGPRAWRHTRTIVGRPKRNVHRSSKQRAMGIAGPTA